MESKMLQHVIKKCRNHVGNSYAHNEGRQRVYESIRDYQSTNLRSKIDDISELLLDLGASHPPRRKAERRKKNLPLSPHVGRRRIIERRTGIT